MQGSWAQGPFLGSHQTSVLVTCIWRLPGLFQMSLLQVVVSPSVLIHAVFTYSAFSTIFTGLSSFCFYYKSDSITSKTSHTEKDLKRKSHVDRQNPNGQYHLSWSTLQLYKTIWVVPGEEGLQQG